MADTDAQKVNKWQANMAVSDNPEDPRYKGMQIYPAHPGLVDTVGESVGLDNQQRALLNLKRKQMTGDTGY